MGQARQELEQQAATTAQLVVAAVAAAAVKAAVLHMTMLPVITQTDKLPTVQPAHLPQ
jgi:hypothetical protein